MRGSFKVLFAGAALIAATPAFAAVDPYAALTSMKEVNVWTYGNLGGNTSDIEGKAFVGGDMTSAHVVGFGNSSQSFKTNSRSTLTVAGSVTSGATVANGLNGTGTDLVGAGVGSSGFIASIGKDAQNLTINSNGQAVTSRIGEDFNAQNFNPNASNKAQYGVSVTGTQVQDAQYVTKNTALTSLDTTLLAQRDTDWANLKDLSTKAKRTSGVAVASLSTALLFNNSSSTTWGVYNMSESVFETANADFDKLFTNINSGKTIVINVAGVNLTMGNGTNFNDGVTAKGFNVNQNVIWNFYEAQTLDLTSGFHGSVLAPNATVSNSTAIEGSIVAKVFNMNGEVHLGTFNGTDGFLATLNSAGAAIGSVPEPSSWMTMITGFGFVGFAMRRQRRKERGQRLAA